MFGAAYACTGKRACLWDEIYVCKVEQLNDVRCSDERVRICGMRCVCEVRQLNDVRCNDVQEGVSVVCDVKQQFNDVRVARRL
jgi:hypothetical protein